MKASTHYYGDQNLEFGGVFFSLDNFQWGYAECVRITPVSAVGAQYNAWWVEQGTINIPDDDRLQKALDCVGLDATYIAEQSKEVQQQLQIEACERYGLFERGDYPDEVIQIGPKDEYAREYVVPTRVLREGTDLEKWIRRNYTC